MEDDRLRNIKGGALVLVIIILAVFSILGVTLLTISLTENKQAIYQEKKVQAYYIARSGAEAVGSYIINHPKENLIDQNSEPTTLGRGSFQIKVPRGEDRAIIIKSTGRVDSVIQVVTLRIIPTLTGKVPNTPDDAKNASDKDLGWLKGASHNINKYMIDKYNGTVKFQCSDTITLESNGNSNLGATALYFENSVSIGKDAVLTLEGNPIVFHKFVELTTHNKRPVGLMVLNVVNGIDGEDIGGASGVQYGKIYFLENLKLDTGEIIVENGAYYFPNGIQLPDDKNSLIPFDYGDIDTQYKKIWQ